jgi:hypothetical protein
MEEKTGLKIVAVIALLTLVFGAIYYGDKYLKEKKAKAEEKPAGTNTTTNKPLVDTKGNIIVSHKTTEINPATGTNYTPTEIAIIDKIKAGR